MYSILDSISPRPIVVPANPSAKYIIIFATILIVVLFWTFLMYHLRSESKVLSATPTLLKCAPGQCPTNKATGEKRCPVNPFDTPSFDPSIEVCNSANTCENTLTPYALQSDGSTRTGGDCESGVTCRCLKYPQCPSYTLTSFNSINGTPYSGDLYALQQTPISDYQNIGLAANKIKNVNSQFCRINPTSLNRLTPGACNFTGIPSTSELQTCIASQPCVLGTLAYDTGNTPESFIAFRDAAIQPMTCVFGQPCSNGQWPVWDRRRNEVICVSG